MKRTLVLLTYLAVSAVMGDELPLSPVCWSLNFAGITLGVTTDSEVQRVARRMGRATQLVKARSETHHIDAID